MLNKIKRWMAYWKKRHARNVLLEEFEGLTSWTESEAEEIIKMLRS